MTQCKDRVDKFARVQTEQSIRLGYWMDWDRTDADWAKPPDERKSYFTMSEENNYTIWAFLKKCHDRGLIYRGYDAMPWCPRCGVGLSQMEMNEGYQLVAHTAVFVQLPAARPARREPARLDDDAVDADQQRRRRGQSGADVPQGEAARAIRSTTSRKGAFTAKRAGQEEFKRKDDVEVESKAVRPKARRRLKLEQIFKEKKGGFEIVGEVKGAEMVGWAYDGPFDELPAQQQPCGYPARRRRRRRSKQDWAPASPRATSHRVIAWDDVGETEGTGIVHIAPGCGKEDFELGKEQRPAAGRAARRRRRRSCHGFGELDGQVGRRSGHGRLDPRQPASRRACCSRSRSIRTAIRTAGAARRNCSSAWSTSGSST